MRKARARYPAWAGAEAGQGCRVCPGLAGCPGAGIARRLRGRACSHPCGSSLMPGLLARSSSAGGYETAVAGIGVQDVDEAGERRCVGRGALVQAENLGGMRRRGRPPGRARPHGCRRCCAAPPRHRSRGRPGRSWRRTRPTAGCPGPARPRPAHPGPAGPRCRGAPRSMCLLSPARLPSPPPAPSAGPPAPSRPSRDGREGRPPRRIASASRS